MPTTWTIYGLMHPVFMYFYYVGVTSNPVAQRVYQHMEESKATRKGPFPNAKKINAKLYKAGLKPMAIELDTIVDDNKAWAYTLEKMYMGHITNMGHPLSNRDSKKWQLAYRGPSGVGHFEAIQKLHKYHRQGLSFEQYEMKVRVPPADMYSKPDLEAFDRLTTNDDSDSGAGTGPR